MKKTILLILFLLCSALPISAEETRPFTVGCIIPLSGRSAEYGVAVRNGLDLAQKSRPDLFTGLRFLIEDSLYDGKASITEFQKFTSVDHVDLTFVWGHGPVQAVAPVAEANHAPTVVISGQRVVANDKNYVIRFCSPHDLYAQALLGEMRRRGQKKVLVVKTELGFLNDTVEALQKGAVGDESVELVESYQPGETDFQPTVTKLKTMKFDLLGLFMGEDQLPLFLTRLSSVRLNPPLFGTHSFGGKEVIRAIQKEGDPAFFSANFVEDSFHKQYLETYGGDIQITWAANAYDFAILTAEMFGKGGVKHSPEEIVAKYKEVKGRTGVTGNFGYQNSDELGSGYVFPVVIKTIAKDGSSVTK